MRRLLFTMTAILFLSGCSLDKLVEENVPTEVSDYAKNFLLQLEEGDIEYCMSQLNQQARDENARQFFQNSHNKLKDMSLKNSSVISFSKTNFFGENKFSNYILGYEYEYNDLWAYYDFQIQEKNGKLSVESFKITPTNNSLREYDKFDFQGKTLIHYLFFFMVVSVPLFILISIGFSIKTALKRKWLWIIFMLFGFTSFILNWTTGEIDIKLFNFSLLGAGFSKSGIVSPWLFTFSIPVGAIIFWFKRAQLKREARISELIKLKQSE